MARFRFWLQGTLAVLLAVTLVQAARSQGSGNWTLTPATPTLDGRVANKSRIHAVMAPIAEPSPAVTIRKRRLVARPTVSVENRPVVDVAALIEEERNRWP